MTPGTRECIAVALFYDILVPGDGEWPPASRAVDDFGGPDCGWVVARALAVADHVEAERVSAVARIERDEPEVFKRVLAALYDAYYSSRPVQEAVRRVAERGPRDASERFDTGMTAKVVATQAGRRRM